MTVKPGFYLVGLGAIAAIALAPVQGTPLIAHLLDAGKTVAGDVAQQPKVQLQLTAEKQLVQQDSTGKEKISWQLLKDGASVQPGDRLRYTVQSINQGNLAADKLAVTQPIPAGMVFVLNSTSSNGTTATYSIDNGKTFVAQPTVQVRLANGKLETRPAPAEAYTHVRWNLVKPLVPQTVTKMDYQVKVR